MDCVTATIPELVPTTYSYMNVYSEHIPDLTPTTTNANPIMKACTLGAGQFQLILLYIELHECIFRVDNEKTGAHGKGGSVRCVD